MADSVTSIPARFVTVEGKEVGPHLDLPVAATPDKMEKLVNQLSKSMGVADDDGEVPYAFYINDREVFGTVGEMVAELGLSTESSLTVQNFFNFIPSDLLFLEYLKRLFL